MTAGEPSERTNEGLLVFSNADLLLDTARIEVVDWARMTEREKPSAIVISGEVQDNRSKIRGSLASVLDPVEGPVKSNERFLHNVLSGVAVIDEKACKVHQRSGVLVE